MDGRTDVSTGGGRGTPLSRSTWKSFRSNCWRLRGNKKGEKKTVKAAECILNLFQYLFHNYSIFVVSIGVLQSEGIKKPRQNTIALK